MSQQLHGCFNNGPAYVASTTYTSLADAHGFIVIGPSSLRDSDCWDVSTAKGLTRGGGSDNDGLAQMIQYTIKTYNADPAKIYVTGSSSGCMMTNVFSVTYPDLVAAATCYSGVAAGCLAGSPGNSPVSANPDCANGKHIKTQAAWVTQAKAMYPTYNGTYPKMLTFHGTADTLVLYANLAEEIKQWSGLLGVSFTKNITNTPSAAYTEMVYGDGTLYNAYSAVGVGHTVPVQEAIDLKWFGIA
jgi:acetylxylan esterase